MDRLNRSKSQKLSGSFWAAGPFDTFGNIILSGEKFTCKLLGILERNGLVFESMNKKSRATHRHYICAIIVALFGAQLPNKTSELFCKRFDASKRTYQSQCSRLDFLHQLKGNPSPYRSPNHNYILFLEAQPVDNIVEHKLAVSFDDFRLCFSFVYTIPRIFHRNNIDLYIFKLTWNKLRKKSSSLWQSLISYPEE